MSHNRHNCTLPLKDNTGLPRIPPNASCFKRCLRHLRRLILVSSNHFMCKKLFRNQSAILAERKRHAVNHPYVFHPLSRIIQFVQCTFFVAWLYSLLTVPVVIHCSPEVRKQIYRLDVTVTNALKMICILSFFNTGYVEMESNQVILDRRKIVWRYLRTFFIFDFLATDNLTKIIQELHDHTPLVSDEQFHNVAFTFLFIRVISLSVRINTVLTYLNYILGNMQFGRGFRTVLVYSLKTYIYIHILSFLNFAIPILYYNKYSFTKGSWILQGDLTRTGDVFEKYFDIFVFTGCYFFGVTHKYSVDVPLEQICVICVMLFGRLYTLFLLADILRLFGIAGIAESTYEKQIVSLKQYLDGRDIPAEVTQRMVKYCEFKFQGHYFREDKIINTLSGNLRTELFLFTARKLVDKVKFFKKLPNSTLSEVIGCMKSEIYSPGDIIVKMGSELEEIYFISTGTAAVINDFGIELCHLEDGDEFGLGSFVIKEQTYCVVALETTEVFTIDKKELVTFLVPHREVMIGFYKAAKARIEEWKRLDDKALIGQVDLLSELGAGKVLEKFTKRVVVH